MQEKPVLLELHKHPAVHWKGLQNEEDQHRKSKRLRDVKAYNVRQDLEVKSKRSAELRKDNEEDKSPFLITVMIYCC